MELILDIDVKIIGCNEIKGGIASAALVEFSGSAAGPYFNGDTVGGGVDTQLTGSDGICRLSARYMLEGTDCAGEKCRIFIENNGDESVGFTPRVITDSKALAHLETAPLTAYIIPTEKGVNVKIYKKEQ